MDKLSYEEFVKKAIIELRLPGYKGIHVVYSGFNKAFEKYFGKNPIEVTTELAQKGKLIIQPVKGGVMLYLPEEPPTRRHENPEETLKRMGLS